MVFPAHISPHMTPGKFHRLQNQCSLRNRELALEAYPRLWKEYFKVSIVIYCIHTWSNNNVIIIIILIIIIIIITNVIIIPLAPFVRSFKF